MNWKLIFSLSLFGLAMALATISLIPTNVEPGCWLVIFVICARLIVEICDGQLFRARLPAQPGEQRVDHRRARYLLSALSYASSADGGNEQKDALSRRSYPLADGGDGAYFRSRLWVDSGAFCLSRLQDQASRSEVENGPVRHGTYGQKLWRYHASESQVFHAAVFGALHPSGDPVARTVTLIA